MSAPWWHCYPLLVLTIYSQWHFRRWVGDIWLMRNRWTSSDMHYTCSFLPCSLPRSLFSPAAELFLLLPFKWNGIFVWYWERATNGSGQSQVEYQKMQLGNVSAVACAFLWVPHTLCWSSPTMYPSHSSSWSCHNGGQQMPLSHVLFLWYDLFNDLRSTFLKLIFWDLAVYRSVKSYFFIHPGSPLLSSQRWFLEDVQWLELATWISLPPFWFPHSTYIRFVCVLVCSHPVNRCQ